MILCIQKMIEKTNLNLVDEEFNKLNLKSVYYSFSKPDNSFNVLS